MVAYSGHKASIKVTSATVTTSTNEAATLSTDGVTLTINTAARRHWDIDSTSHPQVFVSGSTAVANTDAKTINYVQGIVTFTTPHSTSLSYTMDVQYVTASSWANANQWSLTIDQPILDDTVFGSTWRTGIAGLRSGGASVSGFWTIGGGSTNPLAFDYIDTEQRMVLELYPNTTGGDVFEAYAWISGNNPSAQVDSLITESVDFTIDGPVYVSTGY